MATDKPESIRDLLARCRLGPPIPDQKTSEPLEEALRRDLRVGSLSHTFENFQHVAGSDMAYKAFLALATRPEVKPMLLCYGGTGNGKTYLCEALVIGLYLQGQFTRLFCWSEIMSWIYKAMKPENGLPSVDTLIEGYCKAKKLIIDDVGMGSSGSAYEWGCLEQIIGYRYRERLFTVLTTNLDIKALPERIVSRFCDPQVGHLVLNEAEDFRRRS
jgi:DNA replication protein DnaC